MTLKKAPLAFTLALFLPALTHAAGFAYGTLNLPNSTQAVVRMRTLETYTDYLCDPATLQCASPQVLPTFVPPQFIEQDVVMSPDGAAAVLRGVNQNTFYKIRNGVPDSGVALSVASDIRRIFFLENNTKVMLLGGGMAWLMDANTGAVLLSQPFELPGNFFLTPSPNGRLLAYYRSASISKPVREHAVFSLASGNTYSLKETIKYWDLLSEEGKLFQFTPDSAALIYLSDRGGVPTLYEAKIDSLRKGRPLGGTRLFARSYTVAEFMIGPDGALYYIANRETPARWDAFRYDLKKQTLTTLAKNVSYGNLFRTDGARVYFNRLTEWGSEPVQYDPKLKTLRAFSVPHPSASLSSGTRIAASGASGVLIKPDNFSSKKTYPLVVWLHGGPYRHADIGMNSLASYGTYDWMLENLRKSGAVILKVDYRGSYGYGRTFAESLRGGVGAKDVADVLAVLAAAKRQVKAGGTYLTGVSYGGYLAIRTLAEKPQLFTGAVSVNGVMDWERLLEVNPDSIFQVHFNGAPNDSNLKLYEQASITGRVYKLTDQKVLLIGSEADSEVPYSQTLLMNDLLSSLGKNVQFASYPGEDHVFKYRKTAEDVCRRLFAFTGLTENNQCVLPSAGPTQDQGLPPTEASSSQL